MNAANVWQANFGTAGPAPELTTFMQNNLDWTLAQVANIDYAHPRPDWAWQYWAQVR